LASASALVGVTGAVVPVRSILRIPSYAEIRGGRLRGGVSIALDKKSELTALSTCYVLMTALLDPVCRGAVPE